MKTERQPLGFQYGTFGLLGGGHGELSGENVAAEGHDGVARAVNQLRDGDLVTVDGHPGIVTVGPPEFDLELA